MGNGQETIPAGSSYFFGGTGKSISANEDPSSSIPANSAINDVFSQVARAEESPPRLFQNKKNLLAVIISLVAGFVIALLVCIALWANQAAAGISGFTIVLLLPFIVYFVAIIVARIVVVSLRVIEKRRLKQRVQREKQTDELLKMPLDTYEDQYVDNLAKKYEDK